MQDERERAAQDVAFERDYVLVEKRAVEVNAFADEMAANPQLIGIGKVQGQSQPPNSKLGRQGTTKNTSPLYYSSCTGVRNPGCANCAR